MDQVFSWLGKLLDGLASAEGLWGVLIGAGITYAVEERRRRKEARETQSIAAMQVATQLRLWMHEVASVVYDIGNWESSRGAAGSLHTSLPEIGFASSLDGVSKLDPTVAEAVFELIHARKSANEQVSDTFEYADEDQAADDMVGLAGDIFVQALPLYSRIAGSIGWNSRPFAQPIVEKMQEAAKKIESS